MQKMATVMGLVAAFMLSQAALAGSLRLSSPDIKQGVALTKHQEFNGFGCDGDNRSPALSWSHVPAGTQSFAITVYDPDAPTGSGWWHWLLIDIPADVTSLPAAIGQGGSVPAGARELKTDFGHAGFGGPCPPKGDKPHHYAFTVWALKVPKLDVSDDATAAMAGYNLHAQALDHATITATYRR